MQVIVVVAGELNGDFVRRLLLVLCFLRLPSDSGIFPGATIILWGDCSDSMPLKGHPAVMLAVPCATSQMGPTNLSLLIVMSILVVK